MIANARFFTYYIIGQMRSCVRNVLRKQEYLHEMQSTLLWRKLNILHANRGYLYINQCDITNDQTHTPININFTFGTRFVAHTSRITFYVQQLAAFFKWNIIKWNNGI